MEINEFIQSQEQVAANSIFFNLLNEAQEYASILEKFEGLSHPVYFDHELPALLEKFSSLSIEDQQKKLENFKERSQAIGELYEIGIRSDDGLQSYIKNYLTNRKLGFRSDMDIIELLDDEMMIEIYGPIFTQTFRTPNMLKSVSYSLMALETYEWWELFHRSEWINEKINHVAGQIFSQQIEKPVLNPVEEHTVKELLSETRKSVRFKSIVYAPIFDEKTGAFAGLVHFVRVTEPKSLDFKVLH